MQRDLFDIVTLAIALLGAVLGIFSTWRMWINDRVWVRVKASRGIGINGAPDSLMVDIVNLSSFPVTIVEVGFHLYGTERRIVLVGPRFTEGGSLPKRLEPRAAATAFRPLSTFEHEQLLVMRNAFVRTACGVTCKGKRDLWLYGHLAAGASAVDQPDP